MTKITLITNAGRKTVIASESKTATIVNRTTVTPPMSFEVVANHSFAPFAS